MFCCSSVRPSWSISFYTPQPYTNIYTHTQQTQPLFDLATHKKKTVVVIGRSMMTILLLLFRVEERQFLNRKSHGRAFHFTCSCFVCLSAAAASRQKEYMPWQKRRFVIPPNYTSLIGRLLRVVFAGVFSGFFPPRIINATRLHSW